MEDEYHTKGKSLCQENKTLGINGNITRDSSTLSFKEKWKRPVYRGKCLYSIFMTATALASGMYVSQHGPTFLDIQIITGTDLEEASAFFTGGNAGIFMGCVLTGIAYNKLNIPLLFFFMSIGLGITNIALPYCTQFEMMIFIRFVSAVFMGSLATGTNTQHLAVWGPHGNGFLQLQHFGFSVGGMLTPLIAEPFLLDKTLMETNTTANYEYNKTSANFSTTANYNGTSAHSNTSRRHLASESRVEYVFYITGVFTLITAIPYVYVYFSHRQTKKRTVTVTDKNRKFSRENVPFKLLVFMLSGTCLFIFVWNSVEPTFFSFLMSFLVEEYEDISKSKGAFVTALAWGSFAATRFVLIFLTKKFTPLQLLVMMLTMMVVSFSAFTICARFKMIDALIVFAAMSAIMMAGMFPVCLSWVETELFQVTGIVGSCILISNSLGSTISPIFLGMLMEHYSNMWFCYLLLILTCLAFLIFVSMAIFTRCYIDKKYGRLVVSSNLIKTLEISQPNKRGNAECDDDSHAQFLE